MCLISPHRSRVSQVSGGALLSRPDVAGVLLVILTLFFPYLDVYTSLNYKCSGYINQITVYMF